MSAVTFDTHQLIKELQQRGFSPDQAEGINEALKNALTVAEVATKRDIKELELSLTIKMGMMLIGAVGVLAALIKIA